MPEVDMPNRYKVVLMEYERGWGAKVDEVKYFDNEPEAIKYCNDFNSKNPPGPAPDWYMVAYYEGLVR